MEGKEAAAFPSPAPLADTDASTERVGKDLTGIRRHLLGKLRFPRLGRLAS